MTKPRIVASTLVATTLSAAAGCASAPPRAPVDPPAATEVAPAGNEADVVLWPGATDDDRRLAAEVIALTRAAFDATLPTLAPSRDAAVRVVVLGRASALHSWYDLRERAVFLELSFVDRLNLAHETAHALLHARLGCAPPTWLDEAVAQLVAYRVVHGRALAPPAGRPVSDFAGLRALEGASWRDAGGAAYAESATWLGYLLPSGPAPDAEKAAFARYLATLAATKDAELAEPALAGVHGVDERR